MTAMFLARGIKIKRNIEHCKSVHLLLLIYNNNSWELLALYFKTPWTIDSESDQNNLSQTFENISSFSPNFNVVRYWGLINIVLLKYKYQPPLFYKDMTFNKSLSSLPSKSRKLKIDPFYPNIWCSQFYTSGKREANRNKFNHTFKITG